MNVLTGIAGSTSLDQASVMITSMPVGSTGASVTSTTNGSISFTAPSNKTGTFLVTFTYLVNGVPVTGNTISITVT